MRTIKVISPYLNQGMSYKVLTEKTLEKRIAKGCYSNPEWVRFLRYLGEIPVGNVKTLEEKFGKDTVESATVIRKICGIKSEPNVSKENYMRYYPAHNLDLHLYSNGVANTKYFKGPSVYTYNGPPSIFRVICSLISDFFSIPKNGTEPPFHHC